MKTSISETLSIICTFGLAVAFEDGDNADIIFFHQEHEEGAKPSSQVQGDENLAEAALSACLVTEDCAHLTWIKQNPVDNLPTDVDIATILESLKCGTDRHVCLRETDDIFLSNVSREEGDRLLRSFLPGLNDDLSCHLELVFVTRELAAAVLFRGLGIANFERRLAVPSGEAALTGVRSTSSGCCWTAFDSTHFRGRRFELERADDYQHPPFMMKSVIRKKCSEALTRSGTN